MWICWTIVIKFFTLRKVSFGLSETMNEPPTYVRVVKKRDSRLALREMLKVLMAVTSVSLFIIVAEVNSTVR